MTALHTARLTVPCSWKSTGTGTVQGYASTFGNVDLGGDVVVPGAFADAVASINGGATIPLLADHDARTSSVLGTIYQAREDFHGLVIAANLSSAASVQEIRTKLVEGHLGRLSIGYEAVDVGWEDRGGQTVRLLKSIRLWEVSVVVFPMNPEAVITAAKAARPAGVDDVDPLRLRIERAGLAAWLHNHR